MEDGEEEDLVCVGRTNWGSPVIDWRDQLSKARKKQRCLGGYVSPGCYAIFDILKFVSALGPRNV